MTTGTVQRFKRSDVRVTLPDGTSAKIQYGRDHYKSWSGADSRTQKVEKTVPPKAVFPPRPDLDNRLPNEDSRAYRRRRRKLLNEWLMRVKEWQKQKPPRRTRGKRVRTVMPPNGYTMRVIDQTSSWYAVKDRGIWYAQVVYPIHETIDHIPLDPKDHYSLIEKLRRKAYGSGFNPGIFAAEGTEALSMIARSATQIRLGMTSLVKGNWRGIVRNLGSPTPALYGKARYSYLSYHEGRMSLSQAWLAFQYGWLPLLNDLEDGAAWLAELTQTGGAKTSTSMRARKSFQKVREIPPSALSWNRCGFRLQTTVHHVQYLIQDMKVAKAVSTPSLPSLLAVAWEKVPYSFVCDWVAPIGSYLQALRTSKDIQGTVVLTVKSETWFSFPVFRAGLPVVPLTPELDPSFRIVSLKRTITQDIAVPTPLGDLSPRSVFSRWERAANAVALLQNLKFPKHDALGFKKLLGRKS